MPSAMVKRRAATDPSPPLEDAADDAANPSATTETALKKPRMYPHDAQYPTITASVIKALKWGDSRELIVPFLNDEEKAIIHKLTRSQLSELVDARVLSGELTPQRFWDVVGTDKARNLKSHKSNKQKQGNKGAAASLAPPLDPIVVEALMKKNIAVVDGSPVAIASLPVPKTNTAAGASSSHYLPLPKPTIPYLPGMPPPKGPTATTAPGTTSTFTGRNNHSSAPPPVQNSDGRNNNGNLVRPPFMPLPRPQYKYVLRANFATGSSTGCGNTIPPGIVIGEPIPPNPFTPPSVSGTFYSSALLAFDGKVIQPGKAVPQIEYLYNTLIILLSQVNTTLSDILSLTVSVVNIELNGKDVLAAHEKFMRAMDGAPCTPCAFTMMGVSGFMHKGCVVQMQVTAMVRRALMSNLILDSGRGSSCRHPLSAPTAPKASTAPTPAATTIIKKKKISTRAPAVASPIVVGKRGRGRPPKKSK